MRSVINTNPRGSKSPRKAKVICWNYGKPGHFCKEYKEEKKKKIFYSDFEFEKEDGDAFITSLATHTNNDAWITESSTFLYDLCYIGKVKP